MSRRLHFDLEGRFIKSPQRRARKQVANQRRNRLQNALQKEVRTLWEEDIDNARKYKRLSIQLAIATGVSLGALTLFLFL